MKWGTHLKKSDLNSNAVTKFYYENLFRKEKVKLMQNQIKDKIFCHLIDKLIAWHKSQGQNLYAFAWIHST